ncbi:MAG: hypothetical protein KDE27_14800 [Planctomycetes bacterium]|nr:hypothetical protein [Planctomycetota bacterium]
MAASILTSESCGDLFDLLTQLNEATADTIKSLIGRDIAVTGGDTVRVPRDEFVSGLKGAYVVAQGDLEKDFAGRRLSVLVTVPDAIAMSGMLMMTPDDTIQQRRAAGVIEGEDAEAFGEVASVLFNGLGTVLRDEVPNIDVKFKEHGQLKPGGNPGTLLPEGKLVVQSFQLRVDEFPETKAFLVTDQVTAKTWNHGALADESESAAAEETTKVEDEGFDGIPAAPIRGVLAAFVALPEVYRILRQSCRRVGLELQRHGRHEIPNPAAHRDQVVLLDIPAGEDRQFDWCKRIKDFSTTTKVVLLIHHPSRNRVTQAFLSKADAIVGLPCQEQQLSQKLAAVLEKDEEPVPSDDD